MRAFKGTRLFDIALMVLAASTMVLVGFAIYGTRADSVNVEVAVPIRESDTARTTATSTPSSGSSNADEVSETTSSSTQQDESEATSAPSASASSASSSSSTDDSGATGEKPTVESALAGRDGEPVNVVVLGDDTSNLRSEWAQLWGELLSVERPTTVVQWDESNDDNYAHPDVLSEDRDGTPLTIWSASRTGADIQSVSDRLDLFVHDDTDLVVINLGVNDSPDLVWSQLDVLHEGLSERLPDVPVVVVRQGSGGASAEVDDMVAAWAQSNDVAIWDATFAQTHEQWAEVIVILTS